MSKKARGILRILILSFFIFSIVLSFTKSNSQYYQYSKIRGDFRHVVDETEISYNVNAVDNITDYSTISNWNDDVNGYGRAFCLQDDLAFFAYDTALVTVNISDPTSPEILSRYNRPEVIDVFVQGNYAYIIQGVIFREGYLEIVDIHDPTRPIGYGIFDKLYVRDVFVQNELAFLAGYDQGLRIVNISNPTDPFEIGRIGVIDTIVSKIFVRDNFVYCTGYSFELAIFDVSDPTKPKEVAKFDEGQISGEDIFVDGNYAYISEDTHYAVFNVKDVANPKLLTRISERGGANSVYIKDNVAYIADSYTYLRVLDVSDPLNPITKAVCAEEDARGAIPFNDYIIAFYADRLIMILKDDGTSSLEFIADIKDEGNSASFAIIDNIAYITETYNSLEIINYSNPYNPYELGNWNYGIYFDLFSESLCVQGSYAYVTHPTKRAFEIIDISNLSNPFQVVYHADDWYYRDVLISGNYLYLSSRYDGFRIFYVGNPSNPTQVKQVSVSHLDSIYITNNLLFATHDEAITIFDITDLSNPVSITTVAINETVTSIQCENQVAYLGIENGLYILNMTDFNNPQNISKIKFDFGFYNRYTKAIVENDILYLQINSYGILIYNISIIENPILIGEFYGLGTQNRYDMQVVNGQIYTTASNGGISLIGNDSDSDGLADSLENYVYHTDTNNNDSDFDSLLDGPEVHSFKSNPLSNDSDSDLLDDFEEVNVFGTDPVNSDTDHDSLSDFSELQGGSDPLNPNDPFPVYTLTPSVTFNSLLIVCYIPIIALLVNINTKKRK